VPVLFRTARAGDDLRRAPVSRRAAAADGCNVATGRRITQDEYDKKARELKERQTEIALRAEQHQQGEGSFRTTLKASRLRLSFEGRPQQGGHLRMRLLASPSSASSGGAAALAAASKDGRARGAGADQMKFSPPSARIVWPVIHAASSEQRNVTTFAMSSGVLRRFRHCIAT
jgi:hypothetical protein